MAGRPEGGMACLWRCNPEFSVSKIVLVENMCIMLISTGGFDLVLVNVYLKSDIWETHTLADYLENLNKMENILRDFSFDSIFFIGILMQIHFRVDLGIISRILCNAIL